MRGMGYVPGGKLLVVGGDDGFLALVDPSATGSSSACPASATPSTRPPSAPTAGSWRRAATTGSCSTRCRRDGPSAVRTSARPRSGTCRSAPTAARWRSTRPEDRGRRDPRRAHAAAPDEAGRLRDDMGPRALHAGRALHHGCELEGLGAAVVHRDLQAGRTQVRRARRARRLGVDEPGRRHARDRQLGRNGPPVGSADAAADRGSAARPAEPHGRFRSSRPTARTCSRSTASASTGGTCARPHGPGTPVRWPAGRSPEPSGRTRSQGGTTNRRARARARPFTLQRH